jgi:hypothetical protein
MNYEKLYQQLIGRAITRTLTGYKERHHIVPKCMGGDNSKLNLVDLTAREHFIAHKLLCEIYPNHKGIQLAFWAMIVYKSKKNQRTYKVSSREYESIRLSVIDIIRETQKNRVRTPHSTETKQKISSALTGKIKTKQHVDNLSKSLKGRKVWNKDKRGVQTVSDVTKEKMRLAHLGKKRKPHTEATKEKIRKSLEQTRLNKKNHN